MKENGPGSRKNSSGAPTHPVHTYSRSVHCEEKTLSSNNHRSVFLWPFFRPSVSVRPRQFTIQLANSRRKKIRELSDPYIYWHTGVCIPLASTMTKKRGKSYYFHPRGALGPFRHCPLGPSNDALRCRCHSSGAIAKSGDTGIAETPGRESASFFRPSTYLYTTPMCTHQTRSRNERRDSSTLVPVLFKSRINVVFFSVSARYIYAFRVCIYIQKVRATGNGRREAEKRSCGQNKNK